MALREAFAVIPAVGAPFGTLDAHGSALSKEDMKGKDGEVGRTLTSEERQVCRMLGVSPEAYLAALAESELEGATFDVFGAGILLFGESVAGLDAADRKVCEMLGVSHDAYCAARAGREEVK